MTEKAPAKKSLWFPLYAKDFMSSPDVQIMEAHEVGAYLLLMMHSWQSDTPGFLPNDEGRLRRASRLSVEVWKESGALLLSKWPVAQDPTLRYNPRLLLEAENALDLRKKKSEAGQKSAELKAARKAEAERLATERQQNVNRTSTGVEQNGNTPAQNLNQSQSQSQSTNVDEEREKDSSSSALKLDVGGQPLNASPTAPTSVAGRPADPAKAAALATTDPEDEQPWQESPLTKPGPFQIICDRVPLYVGIAYEHYRHLMLAAVADTNTRRTVKQWQSWIHKFLTNQTPKGGKLLTGAEVADQARTGVNAPQYVGGYRHEVLPEVQAQRHAEQQASVQARIAANLARNHPQPAIPQPGGVARTF